MPLTPIDIQQKTFGPELRGYNMDEVDDFLDEVVAALKDYEQRVSDAQDRIRALEVELSTRGEDESAISRALVAAQKQADTLLADAEADAERIRTSAHDEVSMLHADRDAERLAITQDIARMRATVADLKRRVGDLASSVSDDLDAMDDAAAGASEAVAGDFGHLVEDDPVIDVFGDEADEDDEDTAEDAADAVDELIEVDEIEDATEELEALDVVDADVIEEIDDVEDDLDDEAVDVAARPGQHMADEASEQSSGSRRPWERG